MADPAQLESLEGNDKVPELPTASHIAAAYGAAAIHNAHHRADSDSRSAPSSPVVDTHGQPLTRQQSSGSHVDIGHFDPEGVMQLRRTLSRQSEQQHPHSPHIAHPPTKDEQGRSTRSVSTDTTLASDASPFDFEKTLRHVIKRCALRVPAPIPLHPGIHARPSPRTGSTSPTSSAESSASASKTSASWASAPQRRISPRSARRSTRSTLSTASARSSTPRRATS